jgi:hypothetical protein
MGLALGAATCASGNGCNTGEGDAGAYIALRGGYQLEPRLVLDAEVGLMPLFFKGMDGADLLLDLAVGARYVPRGRHGKVDPVFGLHVGYAMQYNNRDENLDYTITHGLVLEYSIGVDFNLSPAFSLGLALDVHEPFWFSTCTKTPAVEYDASYQTGGTPETTACSSYGGDYDQFFFGAGLSGSFLL